MLTRNAAKRIALAQNVTNAAPPPPSPPPPTKRRAVKAACTMTQVTPSATGQGTHKRWLRSSVESGPPPTESQLDGRYLTPPPYIPTEPPATPQRKRVPGTPLELRERLGNNNNFNLDTVLTSTQMPPDADPAEAKASVNQTAKDRHCPQIAGRYPMLGPQGTILVGEDGRPVLGSPFQTPDSTRIRTPPGLGPCGTHLIIGEDNMVID